MRSAIVIVCLSAIVMTSVRSIAADAADGSNASSKDTPATTAATTQGPVIDAVQEMQPAAREVYEELVKAAEKAAAGGAERPTPEAFYQWSRRIELGGFSEEHLQRMRKRLEAEEALQKQGKSSRANIAAYRYFVAEARTMAEQQAEVRRSAEKMRKEMRDLYRSTTQPAP